MDNPQRRCAVCGLARPLAYFHVDAKGYRANQCRLCVNAKQAKRRREKRRAAGVPPRGTRQTHGQCGHALTRSKKNPRKSWCRECARVTAARRRREQGAASVIPLVDRALCREGHRLTPENRRKGRHAGECLVCHRIQRSRKRFDEAARIWINIISKDPCSYCGADGGSTDHIVATKLGGTDDWTNLTGACFRCNASKQAGSVLHFMLRRLDAA